MSKAKAPRLGKGLNRLMAPPAMPVEIANGGVKQSGQPPKPGSEKSDQGTAEGLSVEPAAENEASELRYIAVDRISPNRQQPRQDFDEASLEQLAASIARDGLMQPIVVRVSRAKGDGGEQAYELVAGERRWRAAQRAGLDTIPALVRKLTEQQSAEWALVENLQREDLNPIERAEAFQRLGDAHGLSHDAIAETVGLDRSTVTNLLRLLKLAPAVRDLVRRDLLSMGHSRALAGLEDEALQQKLAEQALREGWSVRQTESAVRAAVAGKADQPAPGKKIKPKPAYLMDLERQIGEQLSTKVQIKAARKKGQGTLSIDFYSIDQFDDILAKLGVETE